jgi:hypothetical protein
MKGEAIVNSFSTIFCKIFLQLIHFYMEKIKIIKNVYLKGRPITGLQL